ncbi:MAG TPA: hypothetical protein VNS53_10275 [Sphingomicrobium sp.]|jgi:hypothetical protein|nr:hypothetical protein [Sphingomicrobium sp.]
MVTALVAALLGGGSMLPEKGIAASDLPAIFVSACLDGEAKLTPTEALSITYNDLPKTLRKRIRKPASSQIWRLNVPGRAFLYVMEYPPGRKTNPRVCGLASDEMNYSEAIELVERRVTGDAHSETGRSMQWIDPKGGYVATATTAGEFKILQTDLLSDAQKAALTKHYRTMPR